MLETPAEFEARIAAARPQYPEAKRIYARMMTAGDDGSWAGETHHVRAMIMAVAVLAEELEKIVNLQADAGA